MFRFWSCCAGVLGAIGIGLASWSSHGLAQMLSPEQVAIALERARAANLHHMIHVLALLAIALWMRLGGSRWLDCAAACFALGIIGFSGGIYAIRILANIQIGALIYIVPAGGIFLMFGWLFVALAAYFQPVKD